MLKLRLTLYSLIAMMIISSCSRNPVTGKREVMLMSESQEIALGKQSDPSIVAQFGLYEDAQLQSFINDKGKAMAAISHRPDLPYEFKILDSPVVNAFALPGGYVYFTRGILAHFNNEAQFAGVLGHEIGHVTARHSAKQYSKQMMAQILFIGGMVVSEEFRQFADVASQGLGLLFLKFSRDNESESDRLGVEYSTEIGYNANEMAGFFQTLKALSGEAGAVPTFLSTHPDPADRYHKVGEYADHIQAEKGVNDANLTVNREGYLRMIDGMVYGDDPRQGYFEYGYFYHPELKFHFPVPHGWKTQNTPAQVQMAPQDGKALMTLGIENANSLNEAANNIVQNNQLNVLDKASVQVNGLPAIAMLSEQTGQAANGQQASTLKILTYLIQYNGLIYKMHGLAQSADFNAFYNQFSATMKGFAVLNDPSKLDRKPDVIEIVSAKNTGTFASALAEHNILSAEHNELAILNGFGLNDQVTRGTLIKTIDRQGGVISVDTPPSNTTNTTKPNNTQPTNTKSSTTKSSPTNTTNTSGSSNTSSTKTTNTNKGKSKVVPKKVPKKPKG
jgi:predicted Zn-dependent protease